MNTNIYLPYTWQSADLDEPCDGFGGKPVRCPGTIYVVSMPDDTDQEEKKLGQTSLFELAVYVLAGHHGTDLDAANIKAIADAYVQAANILYSAIGHETR